MTNSKREVLSTTGGIEETTSPVPEAKFVSNRGKEFDIKKIHHALFSIVMKGGGLAPEMCDSYYTTYKEAEKELTKYLRINDRLGMAKFPNKDE